LTRGRVRHVLAPRRAGAGVRPLWAQGSCGAGAGGRPLWAHGRDRCRRPENGTPGSEHHLADPPDCPYCHQRSARRGGCSVSARFAGAAGRCPGRCGASPAGRASVRRCRNPAGGL